MLIVCPHCETSYDIDGAKLGAGRTVRCARCQTQWFAAAGLEALAALAAGPEPDAPPPPTPPAPTHDAAPTISAVAVTDHLESIEAHASPSLSPAAETEADETPHHDVETIAARGAKIARVTERRRRERSRMNLVFIIAAFSLAVAALIGWRAQIVRAVPQTASFYAALGLPVNLRGLAFANVKIAEEMHEGVPVLVVEGEIVNVAKRTIEVPRLRFSVRNGSGVEIYAWTALPSQPVISSGETLAFRSRLASPPADAQNVQVRFFHRRDLERGQ
jgi:predicted Zn finger-like uncharacterized protein